MLPQHFRGSVGSGEPCVALEQEEVRADKRAAAGRPRPCLLRAAARGTGKRQRSKGLPLGVLCASEAHVYVTAWELWHRSVALAGWEHLLAGGDRAGLLKVALGLIGAAAVTVLRIAKALLGCENPPGGFSRLLLFEGRSSDCRTLASYLVLHVSSHC